MGAGSGRPVGALTVSEGDCDGVGAGFLVGGQAAESCHVRAELIIQAAVGDQPVRTVRVRPVDGLAVGELLRIHAVTQRVLGANRVAVEGTILIPEVTDAGANINGAGRGGHHVRILSGAIFCRTLLNRAVLAVRPVAVHSLRVLRQNLQIVHGAGEEVRVTHERARIGELPNVVAAPTRRNCTDHGRVACQVQWQNAELLRTHALRPPGGCGVHHRVATGQRTVGVHEVAGPGGQLRRGHVEAGVAVGGVGIELDVQQAGQGLAVGSPRATILHEVACLIGTRGGAGVCEVVGATHHADLCRTVVLLTEVGVGVVAALGRLHVGEAGTCGVGARPVHVLLVRGDVHTEGAAGGGPRGAALCQRLTGCQCLTGCQTPTSSQALRGALGCGNTAQSCGRSGGDGAGACVRGAQAFALARTHGGVGAFDQGCIRGGSVGELLVGCAEVDLCGCAHAGGGEGCGNGGEGCGDQGERTCGRHDGAGCRGVRGSLEFLHRFCLCLRGGCVDVALCGGFWHE